MPRIRPISAALNAPVRIGALNAKRKPRHIDNGLLALSWIYRRTDNQKKARWLTVEHLRKILEKVYYNDPKRFLGPYFSRSFRQAIPDLVEHGYIRWNADKTKFRVSKQMTILCKEAASRTPGEEVDRHCAHADYFRQKTSIGIRPTYAMVVEEKNELQRICDELKQQLGSDAHPSGSLRELSVATFASDEIYDTDHEPAGQDEEVEMADDTVPGPSHCTSESTMIVTPIKPIHISGLEGFYPTPQSLPHACAGARPQPLSPSLGRASFSSRSGHPVDDMDIDEGPFAGHSGSASSAPSHGYTATSSISDRNADLVYLANVVNAPEATVQSIEETYHTQMSELRKTVGESEEKVLQLTSTCDQMQEECKEERIKLVKQIEEQQVKIMSLQDELVVEKLLLGISRENERQSFMLSEQMRRLMEAMKVLESAKYLDEESHEKLRTEMLEQHCARRSL